MLRGGLLILSIIPRGMEDKGHLGARVPFSPPVPCTLPGQAHMLRSLMAWVTGAWQIGQMGSGPWQMQLAHSIQKRLWPQGTRAAMTSLSMQRMHSWRPLQAAEEEESGGEEDAPLSLEEEKAGP